MTVSSLPAGQGLRRPDVGKPASGPGRFGHSIAIAVRLLVVVAVVAVLIAVRMGTGVLLNLALTVGAASGFYLAFGRSRKTRLVVVYIVAFAAFNQFRALAVQTGIAARFDYVTSLDRAVFGEIPSAWLQSHLYSAGSANVLDWSAGAVYVSYFGVVHALAAWIWLRRRDRFPLYAGAVLLAYYLGLIIYFAVPTAPPWLAAQEGYVPPVHRIFPELASQVRPGSYDAGSTVAGVNDVAAMPSLHMAITVIVALALWSTGRVWRFIGLAYVLAMGLALVYLGEHYVADLVAGVLLAMLAWGVAIRLSAAPTQKSVRKATAVPSTPGGATKRSVV